MAETRKSHMSLELNSIRVRGRAGNTPPVLNVRALTVAELEAHTSREVGIKAPPLKRLESRHHLIAARIASGATTSEVAAEFSLTASRVSILKADPSFRELIEYYKTREASAISVEFNAMAGVLSAGLAELQSRLEEAPEEVETETLIKLVEKMADRTGHAPKRVEEKSVTFNFGDRLEEARKRAIASTPTIIEGELINE